MVKNSGKKLATAQRKKWQQILRNSVNKTDAGDKSLKVFIDTSVWFSGIVYGSSAEKTLRFCLKNTGLVCSSYLIAELRNNLRQKVNAPYKWLNFLENYIRRNCQIVDSDNKKISRDPKDDPIISTSLKAQCSFLITGDTDILELGSVGGVQIVNINQFNSLVY